MNFVKSIAVLAALSVAACTSVEEDLAERGVEPMTAEQITATLTGNTLRVEGDSWIWHGFYRADGTASGRAVWNGGEKTGNGVWEITGNGELCSQWDNDWVKGERACSKLYEDGGQLVSIRTTKNSKPLSTPFSTLIEGNPENL